MTEYDDPTVNKSKSAIITCEGKASFVQVWTPKENMSGNLKYSIAFLFPKDDKEGVAAIKNAVQAAIKEGIAKAKITAEHAKMKNFRLPIRDGSAEHADGVKGKEYDGFFFFNANSDNPVGIVDKNVAPILDQSEFYSGCFCRLDVSFYAYNVKGTRGIAAGLNNVMKIKDGERFGGSQDAETAFKSFKEEIAAGGVEDESTPF